MGYLRAKESAGPSGRFAMVGGLVLLTVLMSVGVFGVATIGCPPGGYEMMERTAETLPRLKARIARVLYLIIIVAGILAELFVGEQLAVNGDASATAHNIVTHELLYRLGFAAVMTSSPSETSSARTDVAAIESSVDLERLMTDHRVPGISVAVVRNFRLAWAKGYGVTELGGVRAVTPRTLFLAGSISKPVTACGALALVDAGTLSLDEDVNEKLRSWRIPENEYTSQKVTLARLLNHTAGFTGGEFFPGYAVNEPFPTLLQVLDGRAPARNPAVRVGSIPGSKWQYSGDGYLVVQQLMTDVTGKPFPRLMRELVFDKLGMRSSMFEQPLPHELDSLVAIGTLADGTPVRGKWHVNPEMAAGGLWSTPTDLATLAIELARTARGEATGHLLSRRLATEMLTPHVKQGVINILGTPQDPDAMGYGFFVGEKTHRFGHIGGNVGYQATLVFFADTGNGVVIMTNSDVGLHVGNELLNAIAKHYHWNYAAPPPP